MGTRGVLTFSGDVGAPARSSFAISECGAASGGRLPFSIGFLRAAALIVLAGVLASCSGPSAKVGGSGTREYFSSSVYGKASPRVVHYGAVPKGGGRYLVGAPYRVAGHTYIPRDNPNYSATGYASWYGSAFHGRRTANGEIYDVNGLTAAHPTLPLPSYVRVTNLENGRSMILRVNDRGPFKRDRLIDVSQRAADMLGFQGSGTAKVRVDYMGPAPLEGNDERKLLASYRGPGSGQTGDMFASNTPPRAVNGGGQATLFATAPLRPVFGGGTNVAAAPPPKPVTRPAAAPDPSEVDGTAPPMMLLQYPPTTGGDDPLAPLIMRSSFVTSFAEQPTASAAQQAAARLASGGGGGKADLSAALARAAAAKAREIGGTAAPGTVVQLGTFGDPANADRLAANFSRFGEIRTRTETINGRALTVVSVALAASVSPAMVLDAASGAGLSGARIVSH